MTQSMMYLNRESSYPRHTRSHSEIDEYRNSSNPEISRTRKPFTGSVRATNKGGRVGSTRGQEYLMHAGEELVVATAILIIWLSKAQGGGSHYKGTENNHYCSHFFHISSLTISSLNGEQVAISRPSSIFHNYTRAPLILDAFSSDRQMKKWNLFTE